MNSTVVAVVFAGLTVVTYRRSKLVGRIFGAGAILTGITAFITALK